MFYFEPTRSENSYLASIMQTLFHSCTDYLKRKKTCIFCFSLLGYLIFFLRKTDFAVKIIFVLFPIWFSVTMHKLKCCFLISNALPYNHPTTNTPLPPTPHPPPALFFFLCFSLSFALYVVRIIESRNYYLYIYSACRNMISCCSCRLLVRLLEKWELYLICTKGKLRWPVKPTPSLPFLVYLWLLNGSESPYMTTI